MKTDEIRERFLKFFKERDHKIVASDSLIPQRDPTLLFTGAGMNQFKDYFLGLKKDMRRAASSQKCLRTADLDEVGKTAYHHSFFEMLGNFSFGDYFKREAILWAFEFMTKELGIPKERLYISVHEKDKEAYAIWRDEVKIPEKRIYHLGDKTNFWPSNAPAEGPNGPCGPCSEIFFDQGKQYGCKKKTCNVECDCGRFTEVWNLVFTQYDRQEGGKLVPLKAKNIDTGMGLERIACVMQSKRTNFEIDIFEPLIQHIRSQIKKKPKESELPLVYVIADHARAVTFAIADGAIPSNEGRGYVIRKLIRRALWHARKLGHEKPILYTLVPLVEKLMVRAYPDLKQATPHIREVLKTEEERFLDRLEDGLEILQEVIKNCKKRKIKVIPGKEVFRLYDTYGFPDELTETIAEESQLKVDKKSFEKLMGEQRKRARQATQISGAIFETEEIDRKLHSLPETKFVGYKTNETEAKIIDVIKKQWILLDKTPLYAESGGQVGDAGTISGKGFKLKIIDVKKRDRHFLHKVENMNAKVKPGSKVRVAVDIKRRFAIMRNHTATHLLQAALRKHLGTSVRQVGSMVAPEKLRFDFSYGKALTHEQIKEIEQTVNQGILKNIPLRTKEKTIEDARKEGALAFFGEKYGDKVRLVDVEGISKELCGGTHVDETGQIGSFIIISESSVASGVRRIEALTGEKAVEYTQNMRAGVNEISNLLKVKPSDITVRIKQLHERAKARDKSTLDSVINTNTLKENAKTINGYRIICECFKNKPMNSLRYVADKIRNKEKKTIVVLFTTEDDRAQFIVACDAETAKKISANDIIRKLAEAVKGQGGGRKDLAQGGTKRVDLIEPTISKIENILKAHIK